jgi:hypothetical protein
VRAARSERNLMTRLREPCPKYPPTPPTRLPAIRIDLSPS